MNQLREVHDALDKVLPKIHIDKTTYQRGGIDYTIENTTLEVSYLDSKQTIDINDHSEVLVSGGRL